MGERMIPPGQKPWPSWAVGGQPARAPPLVLPMPACLAEGGPEEREAGQRGWTTSSPALPNFHTPQGALREGLGPRQGLGRLSPGLAKPIGSHEPARMQDDPPWTFLKVGSASDLTGPG